MAAGQHQVPRRKLGSQGLEVGGSVSKAQIRAMEWCRRIGTECVL
jgi:hypothetical protein